MARNSNSPREETGPALCSKFTGEKYLYIYIRIASTCGFSVY
jgi:hypothetical protein